MAIKIGVVGKTNTGKTTFFNAASLMSAEVSNYPFTTKQPNEGIAHAVTLCVHKEFGVIDNPRNSGCVDGWRLIPITITDLPGLIKGAWMGKGLGNQFLAVATQSDVLIHLVDASGSVDADGKIVEPGTGDPVADVGDIEEELVMWYLKLLEGNRDRISRQIRGGTNAETAFVSVFSGIGVTEKHVLASLRETMLDKKDFDNWSSDDSKNFSWSLRDISKPTLIVANKIDLPSADENFKRLREHYSDLIVVPASAEAELILRKAEQSKLIKYVPGEEKFDITPGASLNDKQRWALNFIRKAILGEYLRTGVQFAINVAVFKLMRMNAVYPVYDVGKVSDREGKVLPDVYLLPSGSTVADLARSIHSELAKGLLYAIDGRGGMRLPANYELKDRDVLSVVSATGRKKG